MGTGIDLNFGIAFAAGVLSFLSPCVLPLIPAYLSLMGGTSIQNLKESGSRRRGAFLNTVFFVVGFSIVFMVLGILFSTTFTLLSGITRIINIVAGSIVVVLGLNFIFNFWKALNFEKRLQTEQRPTSIPASILFGMAFGAGWSPCIGPILSSILLLAGSTGSLMRAVVLLSVYSLGLGLPFLLTGLFLPFALRQLDKLKKHLKTIKIASGVFLVLIGVLIILGRLQQLNIALFSFAYRLETWGVENPVLSQAVFGAGLLLLAALILAFYIRKVVLMKKNHTAAEAREAESGEVSSDRVESGQPAHTSGWIRPVRMVFFLLFLSGGILSLAGVVDFTALVASWFTYQGI